MQIKAYAQGIKGVQRNVANRTIAAYRTVSRDAALVLAGTIPLELEVECRAKIYKHKINARNDFEKAGGFGELPVDSLKRIQEAASNYREEALGCWQQQWDRGSSGRWTRRLIPLQDTERDVYEMLGLRGQNR